MSNEHRVNPGNFQNELRRNNGEFQNKQRRSSDKFPVEPLVNNTKLQVEPRANREKFSEMTGRGGLKSSDEIHQTARPPILTQNSEYEQKSGTSAETMEAPLFRSNEQIVALIRAGIDEANNMLQLWQQNQRFVKMMAVKFTGRAELDDLMQEGYIGLCEAVSHYDLEKGIPFITYAAFWIRQVMQRYIENCGNVVRIPTHAREWMQKYNKLEAEYRKYYGAAPSDQVLCALLGISQDKLKSIRESIGMGQIRSLNEPLGDEEGELTVKDTVGSGEELEEDVIGQLDYQCMKEQLWEAVDSLPGIQSHVIRCRFLDSKTLQDIGAKYNVSREAARSYQDKAMRELRKPSRSRKFRGYYEEYIAAASIHHIGIQSFRSTWTSEVERDVIGIW